MSHFRDEHFNIGSFSQILIYIWSKDTYCKEESNMGKF